MKSCPAALTKPESEASDETPADKAKSKKKSSKKNGQRKGGPAKNKKGKKAQKPGRHVPLSTAVAGVLAAVLLVTTTVFYWRDHTMREAQADTVHAESVAGKYAVGAATIDYQASTRGWRA